MSLSVTVEVETSPGVWTDITDDVDGDVGLHITYGIKGQGPLDNTAGSGECTGSVLNDPLGRYSPLHADVLSGWQIGSAMRVTFSDGSSTVVKHRGRLDLADPTAGLNGNRRVPFRSYDVMRDLAEADIRAIPITENASEDALIQAVLDAAPTDSQPITTDLDAGVDTYALAFWDIGPGLKALGLIHDIATSAAARVFCKGDGTFRMASRATIASGSSVFEFDDSKLKFVYIPSDGTKLFSKIRTRIRPPTVDASPTTNVYSATGVIAVDPGTTVTFWGEYRDPANPQTTLIGALDAVTPLVATTDYKGNSAENGSGSVQTANLSIVCNAYASAAEFQITNNGVVTIYLVDATGTPYLKLRGRGIYDRAPQTFEAESSQAYASKPLTIELRYQDDPLVAQDYADGIAQRYAPQTSLLGYIEFIANESDELMTQAIEREPGDIITVSESVTGLDGVTALINSIDLDVMPGNILHVRYGLSAIEQLSGWVLGVAGRSELGETTRLGF